MENIVNKPTASAKPRKSVAKKDAASEPVKAVASSRQGTEKLTKTAAKSTKTPTKKIAVDAVQKTSKQVTPSREQIEQTARSLWAARGYQDGYAEQDWFKAEQQLQQSAF